MKGFEGKAGELLWLAADSVRFALSGLRIDRFRTVLSLSGVSIGIFCIVAVFSVVNSLQKSLNEGLMEFGSDVAFIEQMPLEPDLNETGIFKWWEYISRPQVSYNEYQFLRTHGTTFSDINWMCYFGDGATIGITDGWEMSIHNKLASGRSFTLAELERGSPVAIAGAAYGKTHRADSSVTVGGLKCSIIGTLEESGINSVNPADIDCSLLIPAPLARRLYGFHDSRTSIAVRPAAGVDSSAFTNEIRMLMRRCRRLPPQAKDNFSINRLSFIVNELESLFRMIDSLGWITGIFSLLIGGFGIANIMFVSVKERTSQIGLQKAIGARKKTIVLQYLSESSALSLLGGLAGIAAVWVVTLLLRSGPIRITLGAGDILTGLAVALTIGIAAGVAPATSAANLHPAEALQKLSC